MSDIFINFISFFSLINYAAFSKHDHWPPKSNVINIAFSFFFNFSYQLYLNWSSFCHAPVLMNVFRSCFFTDGLIGLCPIGQKTINLRGRIILYLRLPLNCELCDSSWYLAILHHWKSILIMKSRNCGKWFLDLLKTRFVQK